jgi:signal transduction histidine kinase
MKTMTGSISAPRAGLYGGLALALGASVALQGIALELALGPGSRLTAAAIGCGALAGLIGAAVVALAMSGARKTPEEPAGAPDAVPRPRSAEQAMALAHAQKMEALGLLAGGVAHDFNNQLHVIRNSLEILERQDARVDDRRRCLQMIRRSSDRAAALTGQLLAFSRRQPLEARPIDANALVTQVAELMRHALGERITVATILGPGVASVAADAGQLETALLNLAINARDAMAHAGLLTIETANATLDRSLRSYVMIAVSDTGSGMPPEVAARACEPFFTTKAPGQGTGLGLSQVAGFARQAGGEVRISSAPGKGTTVRLYLPAPARRAGTAAAAARSTARSTRSAKEGVALAVGGGSDR